MKPTSSVLAVLLVLGACGGDDDGGDGDHGGGADADPNQPDGGPLSAQIFDHNHIDVEDISSSCLDTLESGDFVFHYAHRSHGSQIIVGANDLEADLPDLQFEESYCSIPGGSDVLPMWDGMTPETGNLIEQGGYWDSEGGLDELRGLLGDNPELKYSMWAWSFEISEQTEESVQKYLDTMDMLEGEFPAVRFVYMTGPTPADEYMAVNRRDRNQQIRDYAMDHGKLLYDFEDLDSWSNGDRYTQNVDGEDVPMEHPDFQADSEDGYEYTHTTQDSCKQKGRAFWGMMAALECD